MLTLKIPNKAGWFLTVPPLLHTRKRNPSPGDAVLPLHTALLQVLWDRAANLGNTLGVGAGCSIYNNTTTCPGCQTLMPTVLSASEGAAVAEHGLFPYKQHRLRPCRARLCIRTGHKLRTLRCFYKQHM